MCVLVDFRTYRFQIVSVIHDDIGASVEEEVNSSTQHFLVIFIIMRILVIKK